MTDIQNDKVTINGIEYVRSDMAAAPVQKGARAVVVVDRGWIFAGDVTQQGGRIYLDRAVWLFRWEAIGFAAVVADPNQKGVHIRKLSTRVDIPEGAEIFRLPVADDWGL